MQPPLGTRVSYLNCPGRLVSKRRAAPVPKRDWDDAQRTNAAFVAHHDNPPFGFRFIADEVREAGLAASEWRIWRLCSQQRIWSTFGTRQQAARTP